ncbi:hypothetical protein Tco_1506218 [Tanacetum coccineum]
MSCMISDILMHSGAPLTCMLFALNLSIKALVDSPSLCPFWDLEVPDPCCERIGFFAQPRLPAARSVGGVPFIFDFLLTFTRACDVASNEVPDVFPSTVWVFCCLAQAGTPPSTRTPVPWLIRRVGLPHSRLSLENALAVCEGCVPLDAMNGLYLHFLGLLFLSHDSDSENWVCEFRFTGNRLSWSGTLAYANCALFAELRSLSSLWPRAGYASLRIRGARVSCGRVRIMFLADVDETGRVEMEKRIRKFFMAQDIGARAAVHIFNRISFAIAKGDGVTLLKRIRRFFVTQDIGARVAVHIYNMIDFAIARGVGAQIISRLLTNFL